MNYLIISILCSVAVSVLLKISRSKKIGIADGDTDALKNGKVSDERTAGFLNKFAAAFYEWAVK